VALAVLFFSIATCAVPPQRTLRAEVKAPQHNVTLEEVLDRLGRYLADYALQLPATVASEHYVQTSHDGTEDVETALESDFAVVRLSGVKQWIGFRDVLTADGSPVGRDLSDALFTEPDAHTEALAHRMTDESARHNLGPIQRTINNPALVLELLDGRNRDRMKFTKDGEADFDGVRFWVVRFEERARPTIIRDANSHGDAPVRGRAWIDPVNGTLVRAEIQVTGRISRGNSFKGEIVLTFTHDPNLGFWVPARLVEGYQLGTGQMVSSGEATYDNYRRFAVSARIVR
jgi:hypothetical protein